MAQDILLRILLTQQISLKWNHFINWRDFEMFEWSSLLCFRSLLLLLFISLLSLLLCLLTAWLANIGRAFCAAAETKHIRLNREYLGGKYLCTVDLLFDWFGISCMTTDNFCFYLQKRQIQSSQTGGQWYSDTSPFSIPWLNPPRERSYKFFEQSFLQ